MSMPHEARKEVERLLNNGEKIGAIRHLMDKYGFSMQEAKTIVEALESHPAASISDHTATLSEATKNGIISLLMDGRKLDAVKYAREELRIPLKHARDLVAKIDDEVPHATRSSRTAVRSFGRESLKFPLIIISIFIFIGLVFCGIAAYLYARQTDIISNSELVVGRVVDMVHARNNMSAPIFEYEWDGKIWMYKSTTYSNPPAYEVDEEVSIFVNRENPDEIVVDTFLGRWLSILIFGVLGGCFVIGPLLTGWLVLRRGR